MTGVDGRMRESYAHCESLVREADHDRYIATLFAPAEHRDALFALYAFGVEIARIRDVAREALPGEIRTQWWREALQGQRDGEAAAHPVAAALRETLARYGFVADPLLELIEARTFDLYDEPMASLADLELYAIRTQSPIFAMACGILGGGTPAPELSTLDAAIAHTIGAILSGFGRHAARRQLFVPLDILKRHQAAAADVYAGRTSAALLAALADMRGIARDHLAAAQARFADAPARIRPALLPLALLGPTLRRMERRGYDPFRFVPIAPWRRQWLLWRAARRGVF
jgi:15-cis-phytoene synthase